jgi:SAM-dependent methyltransferase
MKVFSTIYCPTDKESLVFRALLRAGLAGRGSFRDWEYPHALLALDLRPGLRCLSVGASNCLLSVLISREFPESFQAIDIHPDYAKWVVHQPSPCFRVMDARELDYPDGYFHRVFSISTIEHIVPEAEARRALQEMGRVLAPGGRAVLTFEYGQTYHGWVDYPVYGRVYSKAAVWEEIIGPSGLQPAESIDLPETLPAEVMEERLTLFPDISVMFCPACLVLEKPET